MALQQPITDINMSNAHVYYGSLAQTNLYQLYITPDWASGDGMSKFLQNPDVQESYSLDSNFITRDLGLLCSDASLPSSAYATAEVKDNFMGVTQEFAHTRMYTDIELTFYVDHDYKVLGFFEAWMNYISGGNQSGEPTISSYSKGYYRRFNYPDYYKHNGIYIRKFEKDWKSNNRSMVYKLVNAFPKSVNSIPIAYGQSDLMKVSVSFNYDYYHVYRLGTKNTKIPQIDSKQSKIGQTQTQPEEFTALGNSRSELEQLQRDAYLKSTSGRVFGRSQSARDMDRRYGITRDSRGQSI